jgi:hypothetical protein
VCVSVCVCVNVYLMQTCFSAASIKMVDERRTAVSPQVQLVMTSEGLHMFNSAAVAIRGTT